MTAQDGSEFDYVVVGAGAAGCVVANRLSADGKRPVLLLEAGGSDEFFTKTRMLDLADLFALWTADTDWGYTTTPTPGADNRALPITQGKVLGGGSSTNGRIYLRGNRRDYDSWNQMGNEGWSYRDVLPYFKKSENYSGGENAYHGAGGPLSVIDLPAPTPCSQAFMQASIDHVRAAPDQAQQIVAMRLDPAGASVAATRRRRNLARGLEPLHPAHCARYVHFKMRGRLIARQPAQDHRLNHALAKIVGKTHPRRPHSRSVNEEAEINRFGNPPTNSIRSDTALIPGWVFYAPR